MRATSFSLVALAAGGAVLASSLPVLAGGQCFAHVRTPPAYGTVQQTVLVRPEGRIAHTTPAIVRQVAEQVLVQPEHSVAHIVPAVYGQVSEQVLVAPGGRRWQVSWQNGQEIGCWIDTPPAYATRLRTVEVQPARTVYSSVPAVYATQLRTVVAQPSQTVYETIPAQYGTVAHTVQVSAGSEGWQPLSNDCY